MLAGNEGKIMLAQLKLSLAKRFGRYVAALPASLVISLNCFYSWLCLNILNCISISNCICICILYIIYKISLQLD